jgi:hypothetical protein
MEDWCLSGHSVRKSQIVFFSQVILVYMVVIASIINISLQVGDQNVWIILLGSAVGYLLPSPSLKNERVLHQPAQQHPARPEI